jgi:hypothetical protein
MRISQFGIAVATVTASAILVGCSVPQTPQVPSFPQAAGPSVAGLGWISAGAKTKSLLYISDEYTNAVYIYPQKGPNQKMIGKITDGIDSPLGLYVATNGDLYVANANFPATISIYKKGQVKPYKQLTVPYAYSGVSDVALDSAGNVYAVEWEEQAICVIAVGHGTCTTTLLDPYDFTLRFVAIDSKNDLVDMSISSGIVDELPAGSTKWIKLKPSYQYAGGLAFDSHDNLLVNDGGNGSTGKLAEYKPPYTGSPVFSFNYYGQLFQIAFNASEKDVWGPNGPYTDGREYSLPKGTLVDKTQAGIVEAVGLAADPAGKN